MPRSDKPELTFVEPMECLLVSKLPEGPEWAYEIKLDGYRAQALCAGEATQLLSRNGKDLAGRFPSILRELAAAFPADSVVDGELVALDPSGKPSFSLIQIQQQAGQRSSSLPSTSSVMQGRTSPRRHSWSVGSSSVSP